MKGMDGETLTVAFFAREEGRDKVADGAAQGGRGGRRRRSPRRAAVKPRELPRWVGARARELGLELDTRRAAGADRPGRRPPAAAAARAREARARARRRARRIGVEEVEESCASSAERKAWTLADALVAGDEQAAMRALRRAARPGRARCPACSTRSSAGCATRSRSPRRSRPASRPRRSAGRCGCRRCAADRLIADVAKRDVEALRRALELMADLELESRGGGGGGVLDEDTQAVRAVLAAAALTRAAARRRRCGAAARRATSCARRCCGAARRA